MPALAQRACTKNQLIDYDFGQKTHEEPAPGIHIHNMLILERSSKGQVGTGLVMSGQVKSIWDISIQIGTGQVKSQQVK